VCSPSIAIRLPGNGADAHRRARPHRLAAVGLDLDDLGAHVGEHSRTVGTGDGDRKIRDPQAGKVLCRRPLMLIC
jgi:hypothetical protein